MATDNPVLGRQVVGPDFGRAVARVIRQTAETAQQVQESNARNGGIKLRHVDQPLNLPRLAAYVEGIPLTDQSLRALQVLTPGRPDEYMPAPDSDQRRFLARLTEYATDGRPAKIEEQEALAELVAAAAEDAAERVRVASSARQEAEEKASRTAAELEATAAELAEAHETIDRLEAEVAEANAELARTDIECEHLRLLVDANGNGGGAATLAPPKATKPRRVPVGDVEGVYHPHGDPDRFEIGWREPDGDTTRQRWQMLPKGASLEDAIAARAERTGGETA